MRTTKYLKFWAQSYLIGIPRIIVGYRSRSFSLHSVASLSVSDLPKLCQSLWNPKVCLSFAAHFISQLKLVLSKDNEASVYHIEYEPPSPQITIRKEASEASFIPSFWTLRKTASTGND